MSRMDDDVIMTMEMVGKKTKQLTVRTQSTKKISNSSFPKVYGVRLRVLVLMMLILMSMLMTLMMLMLMLVPHALTNQWYHR